MPRLYWGLPVAVILLGIAAAGWWAFLRQEDPKDDTPIVVPEKMTLLSIDGTHGKEPQTPERFHDYPLLGKIEITSEKQREEIWRAIQRGIAEKRMQAACFDPRHAIRIEQDGHSRDYIICFQCSGVHIHENDKVSYATTGPGPKRLLNKILTNAGIPLARE